MRPAYVPFVSKQIRLLVCAALQQPDSLKERTCHVEKTPKRARALQPDLDRASEIAAKADAENRAMTPEEKAIFDPIIANAKEINNALKQIRVDEEVMAEAKSFSARVVVDSSASSAGGGLDGKRISFKGMGAGVASKMVGEYGQKALAPSGAAVVAQHFAEDPIPLGRIATDLLDVLPVKAQPTAEYAFMRQGTRTNNAEVVAEGAVKPTSVIGVTRVEQSLQVVAHLSEGVPRFWLVDNAAVEAFVDAELPYELGAALEAKIIADIAATSGIQAQAYSTSVLQTVRKASRARGRRLRAGLDCAASHRFRGTGTGADLHHRGRAHESAVRRGQPTVVRRRLSHRR